MATYCNYHHNYQGHRIENKGGRLCDRGSPDVRGGNVKYYGLHDVWVPFVHRTSNSAHKLTKELKPSPHDTSSGMILTSAALRTLSLPPPPPMPVNLSGENRDDMPTRASAKKQHKKTLVWSRTVQRKQRGCVPAISENQTTLERVSFHTVEPAINPWPLFGRR